jgi:hypothetical protein
MITERAKTSFDRLMQASLKSGLPVEGGSLAIEPVAALDAKMKEKKVVVLTVSSYLFRLVAILYFKPDAATRAYFGRGSEGPLSEADFHDRVAECGNVFCGALNRDLGKHFPHVGMSTPNIIDKDCMRYVDLLGCEQVRHYRLQVADDLALHASLCVTAYGTVDFHVEQAVEEEVSTGELEMF